MKKNIIFKKLIDNFKIIEGVIVIVMLMCFKVAVVLKIFIGYRCIKNIINVVLYSIKQIMYQTTLIGFIITTIYKFYSKYSNKIKSIIYYFGLYGAVIISIFQEYLPECVLKLFKISRYITIYNIIISIGLIICRLVIDLKKIYCY